MPQKTIYEWLQDLPQPYKREAVTNLTLDNAERLENNLPNALLKAFDWEKSPQGFEYWTYYHQHLCI